MRISDWSSDVCSSDLERAHHRAAPEGLWPEVRSVIALGMSCAPATDPLALAGAPNIGRISVYAQGGDYHDLIKRKLKALARWMAAEAPGTDLKIGRAHV